MAKLSVRRDAGVLAGVQQAEQLGLLAVVGAGGIARRRPDAAILLAHQLLVGERLVGRVAPDRLAHALVQALGEGLGQAVGQRLQQDVGIVVVVGLEAREVLLDAVAGGDGEAADPVGLGRDEVGQAHVGARRALLDLLAQEIEPRDLLGCACRPRTARRRRRRGGTARRRPRPWRSATSRARCGRASCARRRRACARSRPPPCPRGWPDSCRPAPRRGRTASSRCARPARAADTRRRRACR